jgi:hypothetical protein
MTATATADKLITSVTLRKGFEQIFITLVEKTNDLGSYFQVEGVSIYGTAQGGRVGGVATKVFAGLETTDLGWGPMKGAREYANGWFASLIDKGWERIG